MKKRLFSLTLALVLCLCLAAPASAAGAKKAVTVEGRGVVVTMDKYLRTETHCYSCMYEDIPFRYLTIYVVEDNSTVTVEAMEGRSYAQGLEYPFPADVELRYAHSVEGYDYYWDSEANAMAVVFLEVEDGGSLHPVDFMYGPETFTVSPNSSYYDAYINYSYGIAWMCESDYAKLVPTTATFKASGWAAEDLGKALNAGLFPYGFNPFEESCARTMTRAEFAEVTVNLYTALLGRSPDVGSSHPFTDVDQYSSVGTAYKLGFVQGRSDTVFDPNGTLTRQEAAVMLGRVYAKLYGDIPAVANTTFADDKDVKSWAKSYVAFMSDKGIVKGVGDNKFAPTKTLYIQEAMTMASRMLEKLK